MKSDIVVLGGGPAGLAAAYGASKQGASVTLIERNYRLGGILNQCIHNGFGLHYFGEEYTGPEYAQKWIEKLSECSVNIMLNSLVDKIEKISDKHLRVWFKNEKGLDSIDCKAMVLSMGCRERPAGAINLCGTRPAGVFSAGEAQKLVNIHGKMVGKKIVILGSGDVGLIMARRMTCEGAEVLGVYEVMPNCGGLARNVAQCLNDFNIPLYLSTSIVRVEGKKRVTGVWVAPVKPDFSFEMDKQKYIECDTVLLSVGLIPENDLVADFGLEMSKVTGSAVVNEFYQTSMPELFICGNVMHVNDLVDNVSNEGVLAGASAGRFVKKGLPENQKIEIIHDSRIRYTVPTYVYKNDEPEIMLLFRVDKEYRKIMLIIKSGGEEIQKIPRPVVRAGEMEIVKIAKAKIKGDLSIEMVELESGKKMIK